VAVSVYSVYSVVHLQFHPAPTPNDMLREDLTEPIIGAFYDVVNDVGFGFVESVYEACMVIALNRRGLAVERQKQLIMRYHGVVVGRFTDLLASHGGLYRGS
jgi:hypothetical protein